MNTRLILIGFLLLALKVQGQFQDPTPQSPEASELSKAINYPVGHYTGVANISVPLFNVNAGSINLPFILKYHSGGFKINEREGSYGLGWSLSPTLQISRSIRGKDDLINLGNSHNDGYASNAFCKGSNGASIMYGSSDNDYLRRYYAYKRHEDHEPDQFNYSLLGKSGSFYFQKKSSGSVNIVPSPYNGVKIERLGDNHYDGFKITDTDGTTYYFDGDVERTGSAINRPDDRQDVFPITTWKCMKIVAPNKTDVIDFNYKSKDPIYSYTFSKSVTITESECDLSTFSINLNQLLAVNIDPFYTKHQQVMSFINDPTNTLVREPSPKIKIKGYGASQSGVIYPYLDGSGNVVNRFFTTSSGGGADVIEVETKVVDYITFNGGRIDFNYVSSNNQIDNIVLSSNLGEVKRVTFNQSMEGTLLHHNLGYSTASFGFDPYQDNYTWYLDSITVNGADYAFDYYGNRRPYYTNYDYGSDIWGYPNEKTKNGFGDQSINDFLPRIVHNSKVYGIGCSSYYFKDVAIGSGGVFANYDTELQKGVLKRITYPTKGYTEFIYENNLANPNASSCYGPVAVGGLRIGAIKNYNYNGSLKTQKRYVYGENGNGIGVSRGVRSECMYGYDPLIVGTGLHMLPDMFKQESTIRHYKHIPGFNEPPSDGTYYDYSTLYTETQTTWTTHPKYSIGYADGSPIYYKEVVEYSEEDILLTVQKGKTVYKFNDTYPWGQESGGTTLSSIFNVWNMGKPLSVTEMKYKSWINNNAVFDTIRHKEYDYNQFLRPEKVYYGQMHANEIPAGLPEALEPRGYQINYYYKSLDIGNKLLHNEKEYLYTDGVRKQERSIDYVYDNYGQLKSSTTVNSQGETLVSSIKRAVDFGSHPSSANLISNNMLSYPLEETTTINGTMVKGSKFVYSTNNKGNLIETYIKTPIGDERNASYIYNALGSRPDMVTPENGVPTSFVWGYNNQHPVVKGTNISSANLNTAVNWAISELQSQWNYITDLESLLVELKVSLQNTTAWQQFNDEINAHPLVNGIAQITTYTYDPLIGVTSITDPKDYIMYYEYDAFNRLEYVKDADGHIISKTDYHYKGQ